MIFSIPAHFWGAFWLATNIMRELSLSLWEKLCIARETCFTSNFVLDETFTLLARRSTYAFAAEKARLIYESKIFRIIRPTKSDELDAIDLFESLPIKK